MSLVEPRRQRAGVEGERALGPTWPQALFLEDGSEVSVRPLEASDAPELAAAIARLSPESRYRRFLSPVPRLSAAHLKYLTDVDHHDREALVAFDRTSRRGLAVARWGVFADDRATAEVAVAVADEKQRLGLATALLGLLRERAESEGLREVRASTQGDNRPALALLERFGFRRMRSEGGIAEFALPLASRPATRVGSEVSMPSHDDLRLRAPRHRVDARQVGDECCDDVVYGLLARDWPADTARR